MNVSCGGKDFIKNYYIKERIRKHRLRQLYVKNKVAGHRQAKRRGKEEETCAQLTRRVLGKNELEKHKHISLSINSFLVPNSTGTGDNNPGYSGVDFSDDEKYVNLSNEEAVGQINSSDGYSSEVSESEAEVLDHHNLHAEGDDPGTLWDDLRSAAVKTCMTTVQVDAVLTVLHKHRNLFGILPKSYKSLCKVTYPSITEDLKSKSGHDYYYFGLESQLKFYLELYPEKDVKKLNILSITINNDGLPLFKSNSISSWPILAQIANLRPRKVFPIVLTAGSGKPNDLEYLEDFITEAKHLMENGFEFHNHKLFLAITAIICDAPARAHVKHVKQFSSTFGCDQCESIGYHDGYRMTWPRTWKLPLRSDDSFRTKSQPDHHKGDGKDSPFLRLDIDMISSFPPDFMHQGGGCMKKLLKWSVFGPKSAGTSQFKCRMSSRNVDTLNKRMIQLRDFIPNCFSRKPRSFKDFAYFKATEIRQLLLYTGKIVFKDLMGTDEIYENLVTYNSVCALLVDERTAQPYSEYCQLLMKRFVDDCQKIYGNCFLVYNIHSQLHFPFVAEKHGSIDNVSAYAFESYLGGLKKMVMSSHRPIISLVKGVQRMQAAESARKLKSTTHFISTKAPNNIYIDVEKDRCLQVIEFTDETVTCMEYYVCGPFYEKPFDSRKIGCYQVRSQKVRFVTVNVDYIMKCRRGMKIDIDKLENMNLQKYENISVFMALLHDQDNNLY